MRLLKYLIILIPSLISISFLDAQCPKLLWADEFNGAELNTSNWSYQVGDGCDINLCQWGNNELEWYTSSQENVLVSNGTLKLIAKKQTVNNRAYTSGRIRTKQKVDIKFGRIEARMKMPIGQGIWPAFWMLSTDEVYGGWPTSGELDIMEYLGHEPKKVHGTIHFGNPWPNNSSSTAEFSIQNTDLNADFHDYALEWTDQEIKWFVDGYLYAAKSRSVVGSLKWPFDQKFHFLLNLAVGGNWPGNPNFSTVFPQTFEIDYVRVYDLVNQPFIDGPTQVLPSAKSVNFVLNNVPAGSTIDWALPTGVVLLKGQNSNAITVDWGNSVGSVIATIKSSCGESKLNLAVSLLPVLAKDIVLENFDVEARIKKTSATGILSEKVPNPLPNAINDSKLSGKYIRNIASQYDVLFYDISDIKNAGDFVNGDKKLYIDLYSSAPAGAQLLLQFEDKNSANATNYPTGRHSRYTVTTTKQNEWERLAFSFLDKPSTAVSDFSVNQLVLLFAPNSFTGATYYLDNFEIYSKLAVPTNSQTYSKSISIFPNPSQLGLNIQVQGNEKINHFILYDLQGKPILSSPVQNTSSFQISTARLPHGMYFVTILLSNGISVTKHFVKT